MSESAQTPRERWGTCCPYDPECEHSYLDGEGLEVWLDTPLVDCVVCDGDDIECAPCGGTGLLPVRSASFTVADGESELERLRRWKAEALIVMAAWDRVHEALGSPSIIGESIPEASRREALRLRGIKDVHVVHQCCGCSCRNCEGGHDTLGGRHDERCYERFLAMEKLQ